MTIAVEPASDLLNQMMVAAWLILAIQERGDRTQVNGQSIDVAWSGLLIKECAES